MIYKIAFNFEVRTLDILEYSSVNVFTYSHTVTHLCVGEHQGARTHTHTHTHAHTY